MGQTSPVRFTVWTWELWRSRASAVEGFALEAVGSSSTGLCRVGLGFRA